MNRIAVLKKFSKFNKCTEVEVYYVFANSCCKQFSVSQKIFFRNLIKSSFLNLKNENSITLLPPIDTEIYSYLLYTHVILHCDLLFDMAM